MKQLLDKIPSFLKNFYLLTGMFFIAWLLFFDSNDIITQVRLGVKQKELKETKTFYQEKIREVKLDREALLNNEDLLEKIAREKYFMKKADEDVFVVVEE